MLTTQHSNSSSESFVSASSNGAASSPPSSARTRSSQRSVGWTYSVLQNPECLGIPVNDSVDYPTSLDIQHRIAAARHPDSEEGWGDIHLPDAIRAQQEVNRDRLRDLRTLFPWERRLLRFDAQYAMLQPSEVFSATRSLVMGLHRHADRDRLRAEGQVRALTQ